MKLTIAYLYYDLLNLYGENGNIKILKKQLEDQNIKVQVKFLTVGDKLDIDSYDFIYIGAGTENNQKIALNHLINYKNDIKDAIENNKFFLVTGNSIELFGEYILTKNGDKYDALNVFPFYTKETEFRMIDECVFKSNFIKDYIIGFQNQGSVIIENKNPMFEVINGIGSYPTSKTEGVLYNNFYGTYLIGPILVRNPEFLKYVIKKLVVSKNKNFKFNKWDLNLEKKAYKSFMKNNYKEIS
ncbi:MAG TPA: hypothetical protein GX747_01990 [Tenericutes bacterium]|nr:hypothetical protein [Mycoplasmatota bacterium]